MHIEDHRLIDGWYRASPNTGGPLADPSLVVLHTTGAAGSQRPRRLTDFLLPGSGASTHVLISRTGEVLQLIAFDMVAWHAGPSFWRGRRNCNQHSIGIHLENAGELVEDLSGTLRDWCGETIARRNAARLPHKTQRRSAVWQTFTRAQLDALRQVLLALFAAYPSLSEVVGHDDVARGHSFAPGPAFPMLQVQRLVATLRAPPAAYRVLALDAEAYAGPDADFRRLGSLGQDTRVRVLERDVAGWARVRGRSAAGREIAGWVTESLLR